MNDDVRMRLFTFVIGHYPHGKIIIEVGTASTVRVSCLCGHGLEGSLLELHTEQTMHFTGTCTGCRA